MLWKKTKDHKMEMESCESFLMKKVNDREVQKVNYPKHAKTF